MFVFLTDFHVGIFFIVDYDIADIAFAHTIFGKINKIGPFVNVCLEFQGKLVYIGIGIKLVIFVLGFGYSFASMILS